MRHGLYRPTTNECVCGEVTMADIADQVYKIAQENLVGLQDTLQPDQVEKDFVELAA